MEEALEATILLVVMVTFAMTAYAYVLPLSYGQLRAGEVRSAIGVMMVLSDQLAKLVEGDPTGPVDFSFPYGDFGLSDNGEVSVMVNGISLFNGSHRILRYRTDLGGYPLTFVADKGAIPQAFFGGVDAASLVYHYSSGGYTYVVSDMKVAVSNHTRGAVAFLHVLVTQIEVGQLALKRGPVQFTLDNRTVTTAVYNGSVSLVVQCGLASNGSPLTSSLQIASGSVEISVEVVNVQVQG